MADIKKELNDIKNAVYGREVRSSIHDGIKKINDEVEGTTARQTSVEAQFQSVLDETTGKDIISAPEVTAARVGADGTQYQNLKQRLDSENKKNTTQLKQINQTFEDINKQLEQKASKSQLEKIDRETVRKEELNELNDRIDRIITTPAEGVSAQEIIDARDGEDSLGENIRKIKQEITHEIKNKVLNGNFSDGIEGWNGQYATLTYSNGNLRVTGTGTHHRPRAVQITLGEFTGGNKIYLKGDFRVSSTKPQHIGFSVYRAHQGDVTLVNMHKWHPPLWEWVTVDGIIELPEDGIGNLAIQVRADYGSAETANGEFFEANNLVYIDLTEAFGIGNEPSLEDVRSFLNQFPNCYFSGKAKIIDLEKANIVQKANKLDVNKNISLLSDLAVIRKNELPVSRHKFNEKTLELLSFEKHSIHTKAGMYLDSGILFEGKPTFSLTSYGERAELRGYLGSVDLDDYDYIDVYLYVHDLNKVNILQVNIYNTDGSWMASLNQANRLKEVKENGYRMVRIPKEEFQEISGSPSFSDIRDIRIIFYADGTSTINIGKVEASKIKSGLIYMYFDDATIDHYTNAFPIMQEYGLRGTISVPTERVGKDVGLGGQRVTWAHLHEMENAGWLVVSHGLDEKSLAEIPIEQAEYQIRKASQMLRDRGFVFGSKCIVAPQGSWSDEVDAVARKYVALCRTYGFSRLGKNEYAMEALQSHPRAQYYRSPINTSTVEEVKGWIDNVIEKKKELALAWHRIRNMPEDRWSNSPEFFEEICAYVRQKVDEGVLQCVTWRDTMLQSWNIQSIDTEGNQYFTSVNGKPTILTLPIHK